MIDIQTDYALVVDDEFHNRDFAAKLLQRTGLKVCSAATAAEALTLVKDTPSITLALIDHELPDMTGIQLIERLRADAPHLTLVMATMHDNHELIDRAFASGIKLFLVKPNGFIELYKALLNEDSHYLNDDKRYLFDHYGPHLYRA